ncbi:hypothetical protein OH76DRAFT_936200 [Lentinus brumalis]|uniref:Uncharacterized protein n=1 Tax=Lentinus brumalis TaxID=2498619 RepID=A0A371CZE1_9APHY|nr:hypothetical protein OH76DRAFT_936200 [Polyporus brumalis]
MSDGSSSATEAAGNLLRGATGRALQAQMLAVWPQAHGRVRLAHSIPLRSNLPLRLPPLFCGSLLVSVPAPILRQITARPVPRPPLNTTIHRETYTRGARKEGDPRRGRRGRDRMGSRKTPRVRGRRGTKEHSPTRRLTLPFPIHNLNMHSSLRTRIRRKRSASTPTRTISVQEAHPTIRTAARTVLRIELTSVLHQQVALIRNLITKIVILPLRLRENS